VVQAEDERGGNTVEVERLPAEARRSMAMTRRRGVVGVVLSAVVSILIALLTAHAQDGPRAGGVFKVAMIGEPPTLDLHATTAVITQQITWHIYETLYTYDQAYNPIPLLAEGHTVSDKGRTYTFKLRRAVKFHNGKEMTSADVVASLRRWGKIAGRGKAIWKDTEGIEAKDPYTVVLYLKEPMSALLVGLAHPNNAAAIYPKEVVEASGDGPPKEWIGTGPYRFVEHKPDRHIKLARFKDYRARTEPAEFFGGRRIAYLDEILFIPVPEVAVRLAGVETGEYHHGQQIKQDQYDRIKSMPAVVPRVIKPSAWSVAVLNHKQGVFTDKRLRQAMQAALDMEPIMVAGFGHKDFYRIDPSVMFVEQASWYSKAAAELYNQKNRAKGQKLLKEAGYPGTPVRWITTKEYEWMYKNALVAKQQLEAVGFKIDLQVVDWATLVQRRNKPELFDVFSTGFTFNPDPAFNTAVDCNWPGWWCLEDKERWMESIRREADPKVRRAMWDKVQTLLYEDVGRIKFGDYFSLVVDRKNVRGLLAVNELPLWNVWLDK
jgi:peptide/nickel transport system substrate-binding protein